MSRRRRTAASRSAALSRRAALRKGVQWLSIAGLGLGRQAASCADESGAIAFRVRCTGDAAAAPYTGRVYLFLSRSHRDPRLAGDWFHPEPLLAKDVVGLRPGDDVVLSTADRETLRDPPDWSPYDLTQYRAQAVVRLNPWEREVGNGAGNAFSRAAALHEASEAIELDCDRLVMPQPWPESRYCRLFAVPSPRLSAFHRRDVAVQGMVLLPAGYFERPAQRYPVIFSIPGFGGTAREGYRAEPVAETNARGVEFIRVTLDPSCPLGHHVFADSANNGPWSTALVREFLPALAVEYRTLDEPRGRLLTGHSSGGWSSLWLQVTWPDIFGGVWSTAPDPVDFRDFQRINLYRPGENMYVDPQGSRRPLARRGEDVALWYDDFCRREDLLGPGGQLHSFEAVFSPRGNDGLPQRLWDRRTGAIDPAVAAAWTPYDIRLALEDRWSELAAPLAGKLHVHMGMLDTFYLEGACLLWKDSLRELGSDAVVELHPGRSHGSLLSPELRQRLREEMAACVLNQPQ